jgi:phosphatidylinositol-3-phosphatase
MRWWQGRTCIAVPVVVLLAVAGCGSVSQVPHAVTPSPEPPTTRPATSASGPDHVVVAIFENKDFAQINGNPKAPYLNQLMRTSAVMVNAHAVTHPSQPNYLALFSGSTQGISGDACFDPLTGRPSLGQQLIAAGRSFIGYSEDLPDVGYTGCTSGGYAAKHNPWVHFADLPVTTNVPFSGFPSDFASLPTVAFVVPNLCDDMHDCSVSTGDTWAKQHLDAYAQWARSHNSLLIVTFDENDGRADNSILTLFAGAGVKAGHYDEATDHYRVLRTIENLYGLPGLGAAAQQAPLTDIFGTASGR